MAGPARDRAPWTIGPYTVLGELGRGGMGEVYRARDQRLQRDVAVKVLPHALREDPERRQRFLREARATAQIAHPHVAQIFEIGEADGQDFIALELVEGETLERLLAGRTLSLTEALDIGLQVADALAYAHERGIVHRDLKPANVMVSRRGHAKLLDFGLAKLLDRSPAPAVGTDLTLAGAVFGTPAAMSPEQALGEPVDARSDVFAFGSLLYEMLAGRPAFSGKTITEIMAAVIHGEPPPIARADVPDALEALVTRALRKRVADRHQSMADLLSDLREVQRQVQSGVAVAGEGRRRRKGLALAVVVAAAVLLGVALRTSFGNGPEHRIDRIAVLPLANLVKDPELLYFVDGMHDALIGSLGKLDNLQVLSRRSVLKYRDSDRGLAEIARELGVSAVMEGSVFLAQDSVRVSARLMRVDPEQQIWSSDYEGKVSEALSLQRQIAREIAVAIDRARSSPDVEQAAARPEPSREALEAYLRGQHVLLARTEDGIERAIGYFEEAVRLQDDFAEGYAGLAKAHCLWSIYRGRSAPPGEGAAHSIKAFELASKAIELDSQLTEAHAVKGCALMTGGYFTGAERCLRRAIEINPSHAQAHNWLGDFLVGQLRIAEGIAAHQRARELDPQGAVYARDLGNALLIAGRYEEAVAHLQTALELEPEITAARPALVEALVLMGDFDRAWDTERRDLVARNASPQLLSDAEAAYRAEGWKSLYARLLDLRQGELPGADELPAYVFKAGSPQLRAVPLAYLGRTDDALQALELAATQSLFAVLAVQGHPMLVSLREDPRFVDLFRRARAAATKD